MQQIDNTTFTANGLGDVKPNVTIGGKDKIKFIPNINMSFLGDEFFINLNRRDKAAIESAVDDKAEICGVDKDIFHIDDQGRFKWDIEFASRPAVNSWTWELKYTKGVEFYYQDALTAEEIAEGCERPDEVVGSYAVYCNKANNKYKTGKLCHIYRPFCYDAKGNTIYADLKIADGQLTITIDPKWLDNAVYPVRLDPTIGYNSVGESNINWWFTVAFYSRLNYTASSNGTTGNMYVYVVGDLTENICLGYYTGTTLIDSAKITSGLVSGWNSVDVSGNPISSANNYHMGIAVEPGTGTGGIAYDDVSDASYYSLPATGDLPATWSATDGHTMLYSVYFEYTESGAGGPLVGASALVGGGVLCGQGNLIN